MEHWGLSEALRERRQSGLYRQRLEVASAQGPEVVVEGQRLTVNRHRELTHFNTKNQ